MRPMPTPDAVKARLSAAFPDAVLEVVDLTGTEDHLRVAIQSSAFDGKSRIEQHKMVYAALGELMNGPIHALALTTRSGGPKENRSP
jgi:stress-induced morphogen